MSLENIYTKNNLDTLTLSLLLKNAFPTTERQNGKLNAFFTNYTVAMQAIIAFLLQKFLNVFSYHCKQKRPSYK